MSPKHIYQTEFGWDTICMNCIFPFKSRGKTAKALFCSRFCYDDYRKKIKKCPDCGHHRCRLHEKLKNTAWRKTATKKELKAKSMQVAYRQTTGKNYTLSLDEARALIDSPPTCPYCKKQIPWETLSIDHKIPVSRGGTHDLENLVWTDLTCNMMKGNMTDTEFLELCNFMEKFPSIRQSLTSRLIVGGGFIFGRKFKR